MCSTEANVEWVWEPLTQLVLTEETAFPTHLRPDRGLGELETVEMELANPGRHR